MTTSLSLGTRGFVPWSLDRREVIGWNVSTSNGTIPKVR
jgi:hypothetical protein